jgi:predicted phosphodiesterase
MNVLAIGDLHNNATHPKYLKFCKDVQKKYKCNKVVFMGDVVDWHTVSFHQKEPNCPGAMDEYELTKKAVQKWHEAFPKALVCIGNHDARPERLSKSVGIPPVCLKDYNILWGTKGWIWDWDFVIDNVYYYHGDGMGGIHPAWQAITGKLMSVVIGHCHARAGIKWLATPTQRIFGMDVGCGIDVKAWQFFYGKNAKYRPILGCGVILNGIPQHIIMPINKNEKYCKEK